MISNLSTCGFHDVSNARTTCYILVTRAIDVGFHRITKQIFRFCYKYTGFVSTRQTNQVLFSLCFSFLFTPSWTFQALYRLNRVSARAQKFMQRTLTSLPIIPANDSQRVNDLREFLSGQRDPAIWNLSYRIRASSQSGSFIFDISQRHVKSDCISKLDRFE